MNNDHYHTILGSQSKAAEQRALMLLGKAEANARAIEKMANQMVSDRLPRVMVPHLAQQIAMMAKDIHNNVNGRNAA